jgi:hypothetical protein
VVSRYDANRCESAVPQVTLAPSLSFLFFLAHKEAALLPGRKRKESGS